MSTKIRKQMWLQLQDSTSISRNPSRWQLLRFRNTARNFSCKYNKTRYVLPQPYALDRGLGRCSFSMNHAHVTPASSMVPSIFSAEKYLRQHATPCVFRKPGTLIGDYSSIKKLHMSIQKINRESGRGCEGKESNIEVRPTYPAEVGMAKTPPALKANTGTPKTTTEGYLHIPHMPKIPHRPTKEELLSAATGFWSRLKVRFKWFSIRSVRPWNIDDWSAFVSWFVLGNILWVLVGTTTFCSLVIFSINTVVAQETLARWIGDYLTHSSGIKVVFESAVVPKWKDGVITFQNVFVSRRPGHGETKVSKGSSKTAAAAAAAERKADPDGRKEAEEDVNYTQFDLTIATINVTLSFVKWWNGKGLLRDVEVRGVRGVVDRTSVNWGSEYIDPRTYLRQHNPGDFEIDSFKMDDLLITIHQPNGFRPFSVSIFSCDLPKLRKQWLFYDFLSAKNMSGAFDGSLFTIHPRQTQGIAGTFYEDDKDDEKSPWKMHSRLRIDGMRIDHLNRGVAGPFGWIHEGNVDIVADILFPADIDESLSKVMSDFYDRMEAAVAAHRYLHVHENNPHTVGMNVTDEKSKHAESLKAEENKRFLVMEFKINLNNVKAAVPLFTRDLSYVNQALIRPIVAYINNKKTFIPINCRIVKRASEFDGSWTIYDSGLMEDLSAETYEAFAKDVVDGQARMRRLKKVGFWSISLAIQALFLGMAGNVA